MKKRVYLALHQDGKGLQMALIQGDKNKYEILELKADDVKPLDIASKINPYTLITGVDSWDIFLREFSFNLRFKREIISVLPFQVESQLPYPLADLILYPIFHRQKKGPTGVTLFALTKAALTAHLERYQKLTLDPDIVSSTCSALYRFARHYFPNHPSLIVYHLGEEKSSLIVVDGGKILLSQTQNFGLSSLSLDAFEKDLERLSGYLKKRAPSADKLLLTGHLTEPTYTLLRKIFGSHFSLVEAPSLELNKYAIPIGLCLDGMKQDEHSIQFRSAEYIPVKQKKKRVQLMKQYLAGSLLLFIVTSLCSYFFLTKMESALFAKLKGSYTPTGELSIEEAVLDYETLLSKNKAPFPFTLTVPKVSDVLLWIANHPLLKNGEIEIKQMRYHLVKYPKLETPGAPYSAQVELTFITKAPREAREFHDALLKGDSFVNTKQPISWKGDKDRYTTSFFLGSVKKGGKQ